MKTRKILIKCGKCGEAVCLSKYSFECEEDANHAYYFQPNGAHERVSSIKPSSASRNPCRNCAHLIDAFVAKRVLPSCGDGFTTFLQLAEAM